jgi:hypothetical protein
MPRVHYVISFQNLCIWIEDNNGLVQMRPGLCVVVVLFSLHKPDLVVASCLLWADFFFFFFVARVQ